MRTGLGWRSLDPVEAVAAVHEIKTREELYRVVEQAMHPEARRMALLRLGGKDYDSPVNAKELAVACSNAGVFMDDEKRLTEALKIWNEICPEHPEYEKYKVKTEKALRQLHREAQN